MFKIKYLVVTLLCFFSSIRAIALSTWISANSEKSYHILNDQPGQKMSLYISVQEGGNFDIDYAIRDPHGVLVLKGESERQVESYITCNDVGEYSITFSNRMSTVVDKLVEFEIAIEDEARDPDLKTRFGQKIQDFGASRINGDLHNIERFQLYFRAKENRNFSTVKSTEKRILWYALLESLCVVLVAVIQVYSIQSLFTAKKSRF
ncbi:putative membrane protein [Smittium mucronatum]|uniref:Putative membrane protein n=1 Tax=Smittium mucronatum TaxID=133383 RepID=A0A1R0H750_9FUNG|nr:putative membrane protein [Smittium mucronatum]